MSESARSTVMSDAWDDVRRLRIVVAHSYHQVDPDQVWSIGTADVPRARSGYTGYTCGPPRPQGRVCLRVHEVRFVSEPSQGRCRTINRTADDR